MNLLKMTIYIYYLEVERSGRSEETPWEESQIDEDLSKEDGRYFSTVAAPPVICANPYRNDGQERRERERGEEEICERKR